MEHPGAPAGLWYVIYPILSIMGVKLLNNSELTEVSVLDTCCSRLDKLPGNYLDSLFLSMSPLITKLVSMYRVVQYYGDLIFYKRVRATASNIDSPPNIYVSSLRVWL